jgi:hypothetical protein
MSRRVQHAKARVPELDFFVVAKRGERKRDVSGFVETVGSANEGRQLTSP